MLPRILISLCTLLTLVTCCQTNLQGLTNDTVAGALETPECSSADVTTLALYNNQFTTLPSGIFDKLTSLTKLVLPGNPLLTTLPSGIFDKLTSLTKLDMIHNQLTTLPSGIFDKLTSLTTLALNNNQLTTLPSGIFDKLTSLTTLDINNNQLTTLPSGIIKLTSLTTLALNNNQLTTLPSGIFDKLTSLTTLQNDQALECLASTPQLSGLYCATWTNKRFWAACPVTVENGVTYTCDSDGTNPVVATCVPGFFPGEGSCAENTCGTKDAAAWAALGCVVTTESGNTVTALGVLSVATGWTGTCSIACDDTDFIVSRMTENTCGTKDAAAWAALGCVVTTESGNTVTALGVLSAATGWTGTCSIACDDTDFIVSGMTENTCGTKDAAAWAALGCVVTTESGNTVTALGVLSAATGWTGTCSIACDDTDFIVSGITDVNGYYDNNGTVAACLAAPSGTWSTTHEPFDSCSVNGYYDNNGTVADIGSDLEATRADLDAANDQIIALRTDIDLKANQTDTYSKAQVDDAIADAVAAALAKVSNVCKTRV